MQIGEHRHGLTKDKAQDSYGTSHRYKPLTNEQVKKYKVCCFFVCEQYFEHSTKDPLTVVTYMKNRLIPLIQEAYRCSSNSEFCLPLANWKSYSTFFLNCHM